jgi:hemoglobin
MLTIFSEPPDFARQFSPHPALPPEQTPTERATEPFVPYVPSANDFPFDRLGGAEPVRALVEHFYDLMSELEPALAGLHPCDAAGRVERRSRDRFASFFIGWLGGPQDYIAENGHPRLRMRHARVPVNDAIAGAWLRCMRAALDGAAVDGDIRAFLESKLGDLTQFLRNQP